MKRVKDDIESRWEAYHKNPSAANRNRLVEHYVPLVTRISEIMARRLWPRVTADELASAGFEGLIGSVGSFDPQRGVKFETYCRQRIVGAIRDWQREIDPLGRAGRNFERSVSATEDRIQATTGVPPTPEQLAGELDIALPKFVRMKKSLMAAHCVPLEQPLDRGDDGRIGSLVPADTRPGPVDQTERELIREYVTRGLKEQDRLIITLYYYERLTMSEIGTVLGVSESRVCQRHAEVLDQLRARFANRSCDLVA